MSKPTRKDVAKLAGVTPSTVSNVINKKINVSDKLRERVLSAVKELNYTPDVIARCMNTKSANHIELIVDQITNLYFAEMIQGAQHQASLNGYMLSINLANKDIDNIVQDCIARHVDGIILNACTQFISKEVQERLDNSGVVYVVCGGLITPVKNNITVNYIEGIKKGYKCLRELGHKKIAFISGSSDYRIENEYVHPRMSGFEWCCNNWGEGFDPEYMICGKPPYITGHTEGYNYCRELLEKEIDFTAVIVANDYMALGVLQALKEKGLRIPKDVSIISFDNTIFAQVSDPKLTSIGVSSFKIGQDSVQRIIDIKRNPAKSEEIYNINLDMELVIRESISNI